MTKLQEIQKSENEVIKALPGRFNLSHTHPDFTVPLYNYYLKAPGFLNNLGNKMTDLFVDLTVHQAAEQSPYYNRIYKDLKPKDFIGLDALADFPILNRTDIEEADTDLRSKYSDYAFSSYTTGTTSGVPLILDRSAQEQTYLSVFFTKMMKDKPVQKPQLVLSLEGTVNGNKLQIPGSVYNFPVNITRTVRLKQAVHLLSKSFDIEGEKKKISAITGTPLSLGNLTAYMQSEGLDHMNEQIQFLQVNSMYLTDHKKGWLTSFWNAPIGDVFSFTELFMRASKCQQCGLHHFDNFGLVEVLKKNSSERLETGRGRLVVSGFFPFTQMTPLIRYENGDIVEKIETRCNTGFYGYRFLGRSLNSLDLDKECGPHSFLGTGEVYNILDGIPDIMNRDAPFDPRLPTACYNVGAIPMFWLERDAEDRPSINMELRYSPYLFPDRCAELEKIIGKRLLASCPWLKETVDKNLMKYNFYPPGYYNEQNKEVKVRKYALL